MSYFSIKDFTTGVAAKVKSFLVNTDENIPAHVILDSAGAEVLGAKDDSAWASGSGSAIAILKTVANGVAAAIPAGSNTIGGVTGTLGTSGGWTPKLLNALSTTVIAIKSSAAGQLGFLHVYNPNASVAYVQVFDVATAGGVTLGTTTPKLSIPVPPTNATGFTLSLTGMQFANGIQVAATTTATGSSALGTAVDANAGYN